MEFGKLSDVAGVDFALAEEPPENERVLAAAGAPAEVLLGLAAWSDRGFVGRLYPRGTPSGDFLAHYARVYPTNELNSTYYGVDEQRCRRWAAAVPPEFRFCPKLPKEITHDRGLRGVDAGVARFLRALMPLKGKLGRIWGVVSPELGPRQLATLESFVQTWGPRVPLALELRHAGWFADPGARNAVFSCFEEHGVTAVLCDVAGRRDVLHMRVTAPEVMLRFVGNTSHPTDFTRLDAWVERLAHWCDRGLATAYVFMHQPHDPDAVELAKYFAGRWNERTGTTLLDEPRAVPRQRELF